MNDENDAGVAGDDCEVMWCMKANGKRKSK